MLPSHAPAEVGTTVAVLARHYGLRSLNLCRVVYRIENNGPVHRRGFAYGTLPEHGACGEERFVIERREDGPVFYDHYAFSRPNHPLAPHPPTACKDAPRETRPRRWSLQPQNLMPETFLLDCAPD